jgi:hypothetical protein
MLVDKVNTEKGIAGNLRNQGVECTVGDCVYLKLVHSRNMGIIHDTTIWMANTNSKTTQSAPPVHCTLEEHHRVASSKKKKCITLIH